MKHVLLIILFFVWCCVDARSQCTILRSQVAYDGCDPLNSSHGSGDPIYIGNAVLGNGQQLCKVDMMLSAFVSGGASVATQHVYVSVLQTNGAGFSSGNWIGNLVVPNAYRSSSNSILDTASRTNISFDFPGNPTLSNGVWYVIAATVDVTGTANNFIYCCYSQTASATNINGFGEWTKNGVTYNEPSSFGAGMNLYFASPSTTEDPPGCDFSQGGQGNTSSGAMNFFFGQAHVGDSVSVQPRFGMISGACSASSVTGSVYIATGFLTNFMVNQHLDPTNAVTCPGGSACTPGPYSFTITSGMVGASVSSPNGTVGGTAKAVRAVENAVGNVNTIVGSSLSDFHSGSISIVTPCIQVFSMCGQTCSTNAAFTGAVLNCGDITLTNISVTSDRTGSLLNLDGTALSLPLTLTAGQVKQFKGSYTPSGPETSTTTNVLTVYGTDTTTIGGPRASVTNTVTTVCSIGSCAGFCGCPCIGWNEPFKRGRYAMR